MNEAEKSDLTVVPTKQPNEGSRAVGRGAEEAVEGRVGAKENAGEDCMHPTRSGRGMSQGLAGVRQRAERKDGVQFTALLHHVTVDLLRESLFALKRQAAPGVDGVTWKQYEEGHEERLVDLHARVHRGAYRAQPSKRVYIPKEDGRQRPLGIAALEDKIVQAALVRVLNEIYEVEFMNFSYGFRPERSQHQALDALTVGLVRKRVNWVLDLDIRGFFDAMDHEWIMKFVQQRVADQRVLRLIRKWLKAGVSEEGTWSECTVGTPQGAVISPLLANIYLHNAFDLWAAAWREQQAQGDMIIVRYADDAVLGFQHRKEAERFLEELKGRLAQFGLELNTEKTRLIEFGRFATERRKERGEGPPETFDFLGFTHRCGNNRTSGRFEVKRTTVKKRMRAKLWAIKAELRERMHEPVSDTGKWLRAVVQGYFNYHAVPGNTDLLRVFLERLKRHWRQALRRRGQKRRPDWEQLTRLFRRWLPLPKVLHPYPEARFDARYPRQEPYALVAHVRICAGGVR